MDDAPRVHLLDVYKYNVLAGFPLKVRNDMMHIDIPLPDMVTVAVGYLVLFQSRSCVVYIWRVIISASFI